MSYKNNITMIDDLPDISEIEGRNAGLSMIPDSGRYQKFLKNTNNNNLHTSSGMSSGSNDPYKLGYHNANQGGSYIDDLSNKNMGMNMNIHQTPYSIDMQQQKSPPQHLYGSSGGFAPNSQMYYEPYEMPPQKDTLNCRDVAGHASNCDVCSKLYNNDKTFYIIAICVLVIICILLLKRILDV